MGNVEWSLVGYIYWCVGEVCLGICTLRVLLLCGFLCVSVSLCVSLEFVGICLQFHIYDYLCLYYFGGILGMAQSLGYRY